jgi:7-keto-8-aminopelargonate synthetase-like enzyme
VPDDRHAPVSGRRDPFAPLLDNPLAAMLRDPDGPGAAAMAVPTGGAPLPVTRYADGRERINLGTGNYLGLAGDPRVVAAAAAALQRYGTSTSGSRVLNGTTGLHLALEEELADFYGTESAVLTSSGVNANVGLLSTICGPEDVLLVDGHVHASLHAAAASSRGTAIRFRHNDLDNLAERLDRVDPRAGVVVVVDGVYSMTGELAPLDQLADICATTGARLVVDEAHGLGVLGKAGRGAAEQNGVLGRVDAVTIALSKSLASVGGAIMTSRAAAEGIRVSAMPYVFSAANDPASVAAALAALRILRSEPERVARLQDNCALLRRVLTENGVAPIPGDGAVVAVPTGADEITGPAWRLAFEAGVYTNAVTYPGVPRGQGVLRLTLMATHTAEQLRLAGEIIAESVEAARNAGHDLPDSGRAIA